MLNYVETPWSDPDLGAVQSGSSGHGCDIYNILSPDNNNNNCNHIIIMQLLTACINTQNHTIL